MTQLATQPQRGTTLDTTEYPKMAVVTGFSSAQINLIRQTVATGASIVEVAWYLYNAKRLGLEPTLDQIYLIRYKAGTPAEIVVGINGYRAQAESSGVYAGSDDALFDYEDVGQPQGAPSKATVTVWKIVAGVRCPFTASARWEEFYPGPGPIGEQYRKRPHNQLSVRAESHALRKGFPYQTQRLAPQEAPPEWVEAAESDETHRDSPQRAALNSANYDRILGSDADGTAFADMPPTGDHTMVKAKTDPLWKAYVAVLPKADAAGVEYPDLTLPMTAEALTNATTSLLEQIADKQAESAQAEF